MMKLVLKLCKYLRANLDEILLRNDWALLPVRVEAVPVGFDVTLVGRFCRVNNRGWSSDEEFGFCSVFGRDGKAWIVFRSGAERFKWIPSLALVFTRGLVVEDDDDDAVAVLFGEGAVVEACAWTELQEKRKSIPIEEVSHGKEKKFQTKQSKWSRGQTNRWRWSSYLTVDGDDCWMV